MRKEKKEKTTADRIAGISDYRLALAACRTADTTAGKAVVGTKIAAETALGTVAGVGTARVRRRPDHLQSRRDRHEEARET